MQENIFTKLVTWGTERFICSQPYDKNGFVTNLTSELAEYCIGKINNKPYEQIDALCDIVVFCVTEMPKINLSLEVIQQCHNAVLSKIDNTSLNELFVENTLININDIIENTQAVSVSMLDIISNAYKQIDALGFDIEKAMEETFLEIDSRKGAWNNSEKKWKKFTDEEHKALWYKADYSKALK